MYAIVEIAGQQFKVEEGKKIFTHRLDIEEGTSIDFDKVLLIAGDDNVIVGEPVIDGAIVEGKVLEHVRGDKVIVFKKKRKKGYRVKNGHRQNLTQVEIINILAEKSSPRKAAPVKEKSAAPEAEAEVPAEKKETKKAAVKKTAVKKEAAEKVAEKKSTAKKAAEKKPAEKKTTARKSAGEKK
jgi:large subunit ribosomal protein L21